METLCYDEQCNEKPLKHLKGCGGDIPEHLGDPSSSQRPELTGPKLEWTLIQAGTLRDWFNRMLMGP